MHGKLGTVLVLCTFLNMFLTITLRFVRVVSWDLIETSLHTLSYMWNPLLNMFAACVVFPITANVMSLHKINFNSIQNPYDTYDT